MTEAPETLQTHSAAALFIFSAFFMLNKNALQNRVVNVCVTNQKIMSKLLKHFLSENT